MQLDVFHALWELYQPSAIGPDPLQSQQAVNASQLTEHTLCWRYLPGLWFGGTSLTKKEGSNVAEPKPMMTTRLPTGGADGDWEHFTRTEIEQGGDTSSASTKFTFKVSK